MRDQIEIAVKFLKENKSYKVGDLRLWISQESVIEVTGYSNYIYFENLTRLNCLQELKEIKDLFSKMIAASNDLKKFVSGRSIVYNLDFDSYGKAGAAICTEKNGLVIWLAELKN